MSGELVELSILRALAPKRPQARVCEVMGDNASTCLMGHVCVMEVVVERDALADLCAGHFPGRPIVPGSHLVGLMMDVAGLLVGRLVAQGGVELVLRRAVFRAPVGPEGPLWIRAARGRSAGRIDAEIFRSPGSASEDGAVERSTVASARLEVVE